MSKEFGQMETMEELMQDMVAANLTVAFQLELLRRDTTEHGQAEGHPFAHVLEVFEMAREIMAPFGEEDNADEALLEEDLPSLEETAERATPITMPGGGPFESTMRYLKARRRRSVSASGK